MDMSKIPERVRAVVEEYCRTRCAEAEREAYARGLAAGKEEVLSVLKAVSAFRPDVYAPTATPVVQIPVPAQLPAKPTKAIKVAKKKEDPEDDEDEEEEEEEAKKKGAQLSLPTHVHAATPADPNLDGVPDGYDPRPDAVKAEEADVLGTAGFRDALDDLFGDERWGDLDRQELVRYVMLLVQEELAERGVDAGPVLSMVRTLGECGGGEPYEATLLSLTDPTLLSWQAVPLRNPRGNFRFAAENLETGQKRYGEKAIAHMQHANADRRALGDDERQPFDLEGERTLAEHTEAFRKAKDSLAELVESLRNGESVRPGDLADFQDRIGLLSVADLRVLRRQLSKSLTSRVRAGKTKADRVAGIRESLGRLVEAATAITKACLDQAEAMGAEVHPPDELMETILEGEIGEPDVLPITGAVSAEPPDAVVADHPGGPPSKPETQLSVPAARSVRPRISIRRA